MYRSVPEEQRVISPFYFTPWMKGNYGSPPAPKKTALSGEKFFILDRDRANGIWERAFRPFECIYSFGSRQGIIRQHLIPLLKNIEGKNDLAQRKSGLMSQNVLWNVSAEIPN